MEVECEGGITENEGDRLRVDSDAVLCDERVAAEAGGVSLSHEQLRLQHTVRSILSSSNVSVAFYSQNKRVNMYSAARYQSITTTSTMPFNIVYQDGIIAVFWPDSLGRRQFCVRYLDGSKIDRLRGQNGIRSETLVRGLWEFVP